MKEKYYSLDNILAKDCQYNVIFGERSNGKSYAVEEYILKRYCETGTQGAIIRRWHEDFKGKRGQAVYSPLVSNDLISKYTNGRWTGVYYYSAQWFLCRKDEDDETKIIKDTKPFCYAFAITEMEHDKSTSYPDVTTVLFDEFITRGGYVNDEFVLFMNTLSTIIRDRDNVRIFMLGNTVNKYCPYFGEMGLTHAMSMQQGSIDVYSYGDSRLHVAVEYCGNLDKKGGLIKRKKKSDFYFAFDNPRLQMIKSGSWELPIYPHKPVDFAPKDIKFIYFIRFKDNLLQCEIVMRDKYNFTFIHPKTTPLQSPEKDLIFDTDASALYTRSRKLGQGINKRNIVAKIIEYYNNDKVFFSDNNTGDILTNYLDWCRKATLTD